MVRAVSALPDLHTLFVLLLTLFALYLFTREKLPLEASGLTILIILVVTFQLFPHPGGGLQPQAFLSGFGHQALITICSLMMLGKGMETTGALQPLAGALAAAWARNRHLASLLTLIMAGVLSSFINTTPIVIMLLPMLMGVAVRNKLSPSSVLMPVGLATLLGGMSTTIGTSTNLLVVSIAADLGAVQFSMFDYTLPVVIVAGFGVLYLWLIAPRLLPERTAPLSDALPRVFNAMLHIHDDSVACGKSFAQCLALTNNALRVDRIERGDGLFVAKLPSVVLQAGDRLAVRDTPERLKEFEKQIGATLHDVTGTADMATPSGAVPEQEQLAEIVVTGSSILHNSTLSATRFAQRTGLLPLALHRAGESGDGDTTGHIGLLPLRAGDVVLVQGTQKQIDQLKRLKMALVLDGSTDLPRTHRSSWALSIMIAVVALAALNILPIAVSALGGVGLMLATRCLTWKDAGGALHPPVIVIIVTSLALGLALTETGAAAFIAQGFLAAVSSLPTPVILSCLMLVMAVMTSIVSNNAAGVIGTPIAIQIATELGVSPEPFVLAVIFGANMSYATPFGYQTNLLIMAAGGYRFGDFLRAGGPLVLITWLGFSIVLPLLYDL